MSSITSNVGVLPARLRNFFARYPPQLYSSLVAPRPTAPEGEASADQTLPSPYTPDRDAKGAHRPDPEAFSPSRALLYNDPKNQNPFLPRKIFNSKKWIGPRYGLRQQADLVKLAIKYNVEPLLPRAPSPSNIRPPSWPSVVCGSRELVSARRSRVTSGSGQWRQDTRSAARRWWRCRR